MKRYRNLDGNSGVAAYECGDGIICFCNVTADT